MSAINSNDSHRYNNIRAALYNQPWAITDSGLRQIIAIAEANINGDAIQKAIAESFAASQLKNGGKLDDEKEIERIENFAIVRITGPIFRKANLLTRISGATSLQQFNADFRKALADEETENVAIVADSPGGEVAGLVESANLIYSATTPNSINPLDKKIICVIDMQCCSACYWLASQCEMVFSSPGSVAGSIGVIMQYTNEDRMERNAGIDSLTIRTSQLKGAAIPNVSDVTSDQLRSAMKAISDINQQFRAMVNRTRGNIFKASKSEELAFSGDVFWNAEEHVNIGLSDDIMTLQEAVMAYA